MCEAVILFSHGSLLCGSGEALRHMAERLRQEGIAPIVEAGYLNYSEPLFAEAFDHCVAAGATRVTVVPYFLVAGKFVRVDLPPHIEAARARHPGIEVRLAEAMRFHPRLADALLACARRAAPPEQWRDTWRTAPACCRSDERCPLFGTAGCPAPDTPAGEGSVDLEGTRVGAGSQ